MRVYVIQSKNGNGILMNVGVSTKNQMIVVLVKMVICKILVCVIEYQGLTNCSQ